MSDVTISLPAFKGSTVCVSIINAGRLVAPSAIFVQSPRPGHDKVDIPTYSFLVENEKVGKKVLFELGIMKAWKEKLPQLAGMVESLGATITVTEDVPDILNAASVPLSSIDFAIWSHHHPDHTGDLSLFPTSTSLVVGPGFKTRPVTYPGRPVGPNAETLHEAFEGRELIELDFGASPALNIGGLRAIDWLDDGSLYLLEAPGHTADHLMALARTSADKFVLLAGDGAHHCGEFRPTPLAPLPDAISPSPFEPPTSAASSCPCALFQSIHPTPEAYQTTPFYEAATPQVEDAVAHHATLDALRVFDASPDVLVVLTHDASLLDVLEFFPKANLTGWEKQPSKKDIGHWRFLNDFREGVSKE